jgi:hypothetical protein
MYYLELLGAKRSYLKEFERMVFIYSGNTASFVFTGSVGCAVIQV